MSYPWDMTLNGGFVNGYGFPDAEVQVETVPVTPENLNPELNLSDLNAAHWHGGSTSQRPP